MEEINFNKLKVDKEDATVKYNDEVHKYWTKDGNYPCISATTLIHKFQNFDEGFWASYKALEASVTPEEFKTVKPLLLKSKLFMIDYEKLFGITDDIFEENRNKILKQWADKRDASCIRGTAIHLEHEKKHLAGNTQELKSLGLKGSKFNTKVDNLIKPGVQTVYPELLLSRISKDGKLRIAGQADLVIVDGFDVHILDYKGLPLDTPILTTSGFKNLENITKNDLIFDKDGNPTKILNISEVHHNECYKLTFDNGESIIADHEHRWLVSFYKKKGVFKDVVLTTEEVLNAVELYKETKSVYKLPKILNSKPLNTDEKVLPIDPYVLGAWLGDGTSAAGSITTGIKKDLWDEINKRGYKYGDDISGKDNIQTRTIFGLSTELRRLNLLNDKHIPADYLLSSYDQRLDLLRGFMDADGYYNKKRKRFVMATTREYQADYLISLLATLGVKPSKIFALKYCNGKTFDGWDICFTMRDNPFLLRNQTGIEYPKSDKASFRVIKSVELVDTVPTKCLEVESSSHTFLAGYTLLPTHNTNEKMETKAYFDQRTKKKTTMKYPLTNIEDTNFWHYSLQLSLYGWMIQMIDPRFVIKTLRLIHYDHDGGCTDYDCEYLKKDIVRMLSFHKKQVEYEKFGNDRKKITF